MNVMTSNEIPDKNLQLIKDAVLQEQEAKDLSSAIQNGWPINKTDVCDNVKPYFPLRDTLSCEDGCVFKGEQILDYKIKRPYLLQVPHYKKCFFSERQGCLI